MVCAATLPGQRVSDKYRTGLKNQPTNKANKGVWGIQSKLSSGLHMHKCNSEQVNMKTHLHICINIYIHNRSENWTHTMKSCVWSDRRP